MFGYIYKTTNLVNNKIYIGQHISHVFDTKYYGSGLLLRKAINKYSINNFVSIMIDFAECKSELNKKEIFLDKIL